MKKWEVKMSRLEREHTRSMGVTTKKHLDTLFEHQRKLRAKSLTQNEPCFICKSLALKLGYKIK